MCFQLFQDYYTVKKLEVQEKSGKTPLSSDIDSFILINYYQPEIR